jgi:hypothetical protein
VCYNSLGLSHQSKAKTKHLAPFANYCSNHLDQIGERMEKPATYVNTTFKKIGDLTVAGAEGSNGWRSREGLQTLNAQPRQLNFTQLRPLIPAIYHNPLYFNDIKMIF